MNQLTTGSLDQLFEVLRRTEHGKSEHTLYISRKRATKHVAGQHSLSYQTILDLYTRRLGFQDAKQFDDLVEKWQSGNPEPLMSKIKDHTDPTDFHVIDEFFRDHPSTQPTPASKSPEDHAAEFEEFRVQITRKEAEMLRFIAKMRNADPAQLLNQTVSRSIRNEMKTLAHDL
jgi:hypothetical protein